MGQWDTKIWYDRMGSLGRRYKVPEDVIDSFAARTPLEVRGISQVHGPNSAEFLN
jgi:hypothetical protein